MGSLQILGIALVVAFAVVALLKLWESELSITFSSKHIARRRRKRGVVVEFDEDALPGDGSEGEEGDARRTRRLRD